MNIDRPLLALAATVMLGGCATYGTAEGAYATEAFGEANRQTYAAMIVNPEPVYDEEMETSAEHAADAAERYREDKVKQPDKTSSTDTPG